MTKIDLTQDWGAICADVAEALGRLPRKPRAAAIWACNDPDPARDGLYVDYDEFPRVRGVCAYCARNEDDPRDARFAYELVTELRERLGE